MLGPSKVFHVVTEFRFLGQQAVAESQSITGEVNRISAAAMQAQNSLFGIGTSFLSSFGLSLGQAGILGVFSSGIKAAEKMRDAQRSWANIIAANKESFTGPVDNFVDQMGVAKTVIGEIVDTSRNFGIPEGEMLETTKVMSAMLASKGLSGTNFDVPVDISRGLLKSAPVLGIDPGNVQGQLLRMMEGGASQGDTLFRRLAADTKAFAKFAKEGSKGFNALDAVKRLDLIRKGLGELGNNAEVNADRLNSLNGQMNIFSSLTRGVMNIFAPLGEAIRQPLIDVLKGVNRLLMNEGKNIVGNLAEMLRGSMQDPKALFTNLSQAASLEGDIKKTIGVITFTEIISGLGLVIAMTGRMAWLAHPAIGGIATVLALTWHAAENARGILGVLAKTLIEVAKAAAIAELSFRGMRFFNLLPAGMGRLSWLITGLRFVLTRLLVPLALVTAAFSLMSRASAIAQVKDAEQAPALMERISAAAVKVKEGFSELMYPFTMLFNSVAEFISPMFALSFWADTAVGYLESLGTALSLFGSLMLKGVAAFSGAIFAIRMSIRELKKGFFADPDKVFGDMPNNFKKEYDSFLARNKYQPGEEGGNVVQKNQTNINKVEIRQDFKENMEPDRVAHSLVKTLSDLGKNRTQASGFSLQGAMAR